ncbi:sensor histidine kinase [Ancylobacter vacuolatus]|uniref:histidine kinase n=1 Tax=Ancylobacter vacuolatus TaxID=223389 RepID=A0ABU0DNJ5_9HYPH|nr:PAS domain-containing sensor histidine kinase [Ancylobacter vacuolatus]MDQ0349795.1 signal transduction histidine kinase [Ancylobacter vacuolatus]
MAHPAGKGGTEDGWRLDARAASGPRPVPSLVIRLAPRQWRRLAARLLRRLARQMARVLASAPAKVAGVAGSGLAAHSFPAHAQPAGQPAADGLFAVLAVQDPSALIGLALVVGLIVFAATTAIVHLRYRRQSLRREAEAFGEIARLEAQIDEARALLMAEPQIVVVWRDPAAEPEIIGNTPAFTGVAAPARILAFGAWLSPASAGEIEAAVDRLRARGAPLTATLATQDGRFVEAEGRPVGSAVVLRLRDITGVRLDQARLEAAYRALDDETSALRALLEALPAPVWVGGEDGRLRWSNAAYAHAVEARDGHDATQRDLSLLDRQTRSRAQALHADSQPFKARLPVVIAGTRQVRDVLEVPVGGGAAGIALDATEAETVRAELAHVVGAHRRTLDQLATAVAIFGADQRLVFHNAAYASLFELDAAFLDDRPTDGAVLDRLRAARRLPEQADFRVWREDLHGAYRAIEPREHWWHLPGGRTLRVVTAPNPEGGVTYLFDEVTERLALESRFNSLTRIQSETLDALAEAVAVFGSDGRLGLSNSAFRRLWNLDKAALGAHPHIDAVAEACRRLTADGAVWPTLRAAVTGIEARVPTEFRMERSDGIILDGSTQPLPDGGTLVTLRDITDSVHVERALVERNEALVAADHLKSTFVGHVSYELRSPLTTIIGFAQLLDDTGIGPLNPKQRAYVNHITESSAALLAIINDILDLATIDAGAMTLELGEVDLRAAMEAAAEGVRDRLAEGGIRLSIEPPPAAGTFRADGKRVRQVLYNLLSNAVGFAPEGSTVTLSAERRDDKVVFRVRDTGPGVPPEISARVFDRFESHTAGSRHRGVGLGLSIVRSLVALHGGTVSLSAAPGGGTLVTCTFPRAADAGRDAAE